MTLQEAIRWVTHASVEDLTTLQIVIDALAKAPQSRIGRHIDDKPAIDIVKGVIAKKVVSNRAVPRKKAKKAKRATKRGHKAGSLTDKVWQSLKQSSGGVTSTKLAEILGQQMPKVSNCLTTLIRKHPSLLKRERRDNEFHYYYKS